MSRRFAPGAGMTGLAAVLLVVMVTLGFWQLERADEKRGYQQRYLERVGGLPRRPPASLDGADFLRLEINGAFEPEGHYLVDNRIRDGRPGYWVVSRFQEEGGSVFLINRGWLPAPPSRDVLPEVPTPQEPLTLVAVVWPYTGLPPLLGSDSWAGGWPKRVQRLNVARMAGGDAAVVAAELRLEPGQPGVFAAAPVDASFQPERHVAYAWQWFGLAGALCAGYLAYALRRQEKTR